MYMYVYGPVYPVSWCRPIRYNNAGCICHSSDRRRQRSCFERWVRINFYFLLFICPLISNHPVSFSHFSGYQVRSLLSSTCILTKSVYNLSTGDFSFSASHFTIVSQHPSTTQTGWIWRTIVARWSSRPIISLESRSMFVNCFSVRCKYARCYGKETNTIIFELHSLCEHFFQCYCPYWSFAFFWNPSHFCPIVPQSRSTDCHLIPATSFLLIRRARIHLPSAVNSVEKFLSLHPRRRRSESRSNASSSRRQTSFLLYTHLTFGPC